MIFDTHAHYDDEAFDEDREVILSSLKANNISYVTNIGASIASSRMSLELAKKNNFIFAAIGVHPNEVDELNEYLDEYLEEKQEVKNLTEETIKKEEPKQVPLNQDRRDRCLSALQGLRVASASGFSACDR